MLTGWQTTQKKGAETQLFCLDGVKAALTAPVRCRQDAGAGQMFVLEVFMFFVGDGCREGRISGELMTVLSRALLKPQPG